MGTRGAVGIRMNGEDKVGYNHFDSYPEGLGNEIVTWLKNTNKEELKYLFNGIDFESDSDVFDWGEHKMNHNFEEYSGFLGNSLFCEYAYIINLDDDVLEFYEGFNKNPDAKGRYASLKSDKDTDYYGVKLVQKIPLKDMFTGKYKTDENGFVKK